MLEKINEKLEKEIEKILIKETISAEEIQFLFNERTRLDSIKLAEENKLKEEESKKKMEELAKNMMTYALNP